MVCHRQCLGRTTRLQRLPARSASRSTRCGGTGRKIRVERDASNRRVVPVSEVERLKAPKARSSSRPATACVLVRLVTVEGLLAQVELDVIAPAHVVAIITRDSAEQLPAKAGASATAVVKTVMAER